MIFFCQFFQRKFFLTILLQTALDLPDHGNTFIVWYDVFTFPSSNLGINSCVCLEIDKECLKCYRENAFSVRRYKAYINADFPSVMQSRTDAITNPFDFNVISFIAYPQQIRPGNEWLDVDTLQY